MSSLNKAMIIGRVGRDPEVRYLPSGQAVCNFSVATSEKWKDKTTGESQEATEWHRITAFDRLAEIVGEYVRRGSLVYIEGKIQTRKYTDKDGAEKTSTEIRATSMNMLGSKPEGGEEDGQPQQQQRRAPAAQPQQQGGYRSSAPRQAPGPRTPAPAQGGGSGFDDFDSSDIPF